MSLCLSVCIFIPLFLFVSVEHVLLRTLTEYAKLLFYYCIECL